MPYATEFIFDTVESNQDLIVYQVFMGETIRARYYCC